MAQRYYEMMSKIGTGVIRSGSLSKIPISAQSAAQLVVDKVPGAFGGVATAIFAILGGERTVFA